MIRRSRGLIGSTSTFRKQSTFEIADDERVPKSREGIETERARAS